MEDNEVRAGGYENPANPIDGSAIDCTIGSECNDTGVAITKSNALSYTPLYAGVNLISNVVAQLPWVVYQRLDKGKRRAPEHPAYKLLKTAPNHLSTSFTLRKVLIADAILWGNGYCYIEKDPLTQRPTAIYRLLPDRTEYGIVGNDYVFATKVGSEVRYLRSDEVLHIPSLYGKSVVDLFKQAIGLGKATEKYGSKFFGSGTAVRGVLEHPGTLGDKARNNLRGSWDQLYRGLENSHKVALLEEGMTFRQISVSPEDSQFLQTRQFQVNEVARILCLPASKIGGDRGGNTYNNREADETEFVLDSITPWLVLLEQEANRKLFYEDEKDSYFSELLVDGRLRGDSAARSTFYKMQFDIGAITPDEIRELENRNPYEGGVGTEPVINGSYVKLKDVGANIVPGAAEQPADEPATDSTPAPEAETKSTPEPQPDTASRARVQARYTGLLVDAFKRSTPATVAEAVRPVLLAYADTVAELAARDVGGEPMAPDASFVAKYADGVAVRFAKLTEPVPAEKLGQREAVRARHAFTHHAYSRAGVKALRWIGGAHHGKSVAIDASFVDGRTLRHPDADTEGELMPAA